MVLRRLAAVQAVHRNRRRDSKESGLSRSRCHRRRHLEASERVLQRHGYRQGQAGQDPDSARPSVGTSTPVAVVSPISSCFWRRIGRGMGGSADRRWRRTWRKSMTSDSPVPSPRRPTPSQSRRTQGRRADILHIGNSAALRCRKPTASAASPTGARYAGRMVNDAASAASKEVMTASTCPGHVDF